MRVTWRCGKTARQYTERLSLWLGRHLDRQRPCLENALEGQHPGGASCGSLAAHSTLQPRAGGPESPHRGILAPSGASGGGGERLLGPIAAEPCGRPYTGLTR